MPLILTDMTGKGVYLEVIFHIYGQGVYHKVNLEVLDIFSLSITHDLEPNLQACMF